MTQKTVLVAGKEYEVRRVGTSAHKATARVRGGAIIIKIPVCWPREEGFKAALELEKKVVAGLQENPGRFERAPLQFRDGQEVALLGHSYRIRVLDGQGERTSSAMLKGEVVEVAVAQGLDEKTREKHVSDLARRVISSAILHAVDARVRELNAKHFGFALRKVFIKDNSSNWGSCSEGGNINIGFRLLFAPEDCLDYVIVHELAHLKEKSHSPAFWALVEKSVPDCKERQRWLKENWAKLGVAATPSANEASASGASQNFLDKSMEAAGTGLKQGIEGA